jgi:pimeloyl-ACP methyl ester carboxylesterase
VATKEAYVQRMPDARLVVIEDARHAVPAERPQAFNAALAAFLAEQG